MSMLPPPSYDPTTLPPPGPLSLPPPHPSGEEPRPRRRRRRLAALFVVLTVAVAAVWFLRRPPAPLDVVHAAAAGGMGCASHDPRYADGAGADGWCRQAAVSDLLLDRPLDVLFGLGDYQYEEARTADYRDVYDPTWGRFRSQTRPAIGNQEYKVHQANTYRDYFGAKVPADRAWYSYDIGAWHAIVLDSNCALAGGCDDGSEQLEWLRADLAANPAACTVAYWHHPRWSTGLHGSDSRVDAFWRTLVDAGVDLVLTAHEHHYERFAPLDADGHPADAGMRSFVVGTGGQAVYGPDETTGEAGTRRAQAEGSQRRIDDSQGVLLLTLRADGYDWQFLGVDGAEVLDRGDDTCH